MSDIFLNYLSKVKSGYEDLMPKEQQNEENCLSKSSSQMSSPRILREAHLNNYNNYIQDF